MKPTQAPLALRILADRIILDADAHGTRFGDRKVFLSTIPGIDIADPEWRQLLLDLSLAGLIQLSRADLVAAMDPALVAASEWRLDGITTWHFLTLPGHFARW